MAVIYGGGPFGRTGPPHTVDDPDPRSLSSFLEQYKRDMEKLRETEAELEAIKRAVKLLKTFF